MNYVRFAGCKEVYMMDIDVLGKNLVQLYPPFPDVDVTAGFEILTKGGKKYGDYSGFTTIHRKLAGGSVVLSNDGSVYEPPVYKVTFVVHNGTLVGEAEQTPGSFEKLVVPEVVTHENYEFLGWNPEIPEKGKLEKDYIF